MGASQPANENTGGTVLAGGGGQRVFRVSYHGTGRYYMGGFIQELDIR
jgi:hypothetical protein